MRIGITAHVRDGSYPLASALLANATEGLFMPEVTKTERLSLADIKVDPVCQARAALSARTVHEYVEIMKAEGDNVFPPVVVFHDGTDHWLSDGFHRHAAAEKAGRHSLKADIREGSRRDAILHAVGANAAHGLRRTNADKHRAVTMLLEDEEWGSWSDGHIARQCGVSPRFVASVRKDTPHGSESTTRNYVHPKTGRRTKMKINNIGKKDGLEELLSIAPDRDEVPPQDWFVAPETAAADDGTAEVTGDERMPTSDPAGSSDEIQLQELTSAWARASEEVRQQFLANVGALLSPRAEAGPGVIEPKPSQEPGPSESAEPSATELQENPLMEIWKGLRGHTQTYGRMWVEAGCPSELHPNEHFTSTEKLVPFRAAAKAATPEQRQQFVELSRAA
jgi:hypothetical protein